MPVRNDHRPHKLNHSSERFGKPNPGASRARGNSSQSHGPCTAPRCPSCGEPAATSPELDRTEQRRHSPLRGVGPRVQPEHSPWASPPRLRTPQADPQGDRGGAQRGCIILQSQLGALHCQPSKSSSHHSGDRTGILSSGEGKGCRVLPPKMWGGKLFQTLYFRGAQPIMGS